jgi:hypothetical protein
VHPILDQFNEAIRAVGHLYAKVAWKCAKKKEQMTLKTIIFGGAERIG